MPRQIKEIKNFHTGTVINTSESDISDDTAAFSLNIDPTSEGGVLDAINNDKVVLSTDNKLTTLLNPISWGNTTAYAASVRDISIFEESRDDDEESQDAWNREMLFNYLLVNYLLVNYLLLHVTQFNHTTLTVGYNFDGGLQLRRWEISIILQVIL